MSFDIARPSPVPSLVGLVVKNGSKIRCTTSGGMPVPLSRTAITADSSVLRVLSQMVGKYGSPAPSSSATILPASPPRSLQRLLAA